MRSSAAASCTCTLVVALLLSCGAAAGRPRQQLLLHAVLPRMAQRVHHACVLLQLPVVLQVCRIHQLLLRL